MSGTSPPERRRGARDPADDAAKDPGSETDDQRLESLLREERVVRARLERQIEELRVEYDRLAARIDERANSGRRVEAPPADRKPAAKANAVAAEPPAPPAADVAPDRPRSSSWGAGMLVAAGLGLAAAFGAGALVASGSDDERPPARPAPVATRPSAPTLPVPVLPCGDVVPGAELRQNVVCRLRGRTIALSAGDRPVELSEIALRVSDVTSSGGRVEIQTRVSNRTGRAQRLATRPRNVYMALGDRRIYGTASQALELAPGETARYTVRFALDAAAQQALLASEGRFDLGVVGFGADPANRASVRQVGVVRLDV